MNSVYLEILAWSASIYYFFCIIPLFSFKVNNSDNDNLLQYYNKYLILLLCVNIIERGYIYVGTNYYDIIMPFVNWAGVEDTNFFRIFYYLISTYFLGKFYYNILKKDPIAPFIKWTAILGSFAMIVNYFFIEGYKVVGVFNPNFDTLFCMFISGYYLWHLLKADYKVPITKNSYFWISLGLFMLCSISLIFRFLGNELHQYNYDLYLQFLIGKNMVDIVAQILYAIGFYYAFYTRYLHEENT